MLNELTISLRRIKYLLVVLLMSAGWTATAQGVQLTVITHSEGAPAQLTMTELRTVLKGERQRWPEGAKVRIALMKTTTPIGRSTCEKVYNMSADKVRRFWLELSFAGNADAPTFCNTVEELEAFVAQNPGAIGIVDKFSGAAGIKITEIDGKPSF